MKKMIKLTFNRGKNKVSFLELFKNLKIICVLTGIIPILFFIIFALMYLNKKQMPIIFLLSALYSIGIGIIFNIKALKKYNSIISVMNTQCNMKKFIDINNKLKEDQKKNHANSLMLAINLSTAYLTKGDNDKAKEMLDEIKTEKFEENEEDQKYYLAYLYNTSIYYMQIKDCKSYNESIETLKELLNKSVFRSYEEQYKKMIEYLEHRKNMNSEDLGTSKEFWKDSIINAKNMISKVEGEYYLACIYKTEGNIEEAEKSYCFAAENGGDSFLL